jgi:hypothetical protein
MFKFIENIKKKAQDIVDKGEQYYLINDRVLEIRRDRFNFQQSILTKPDYYFVLLLVNYYVYKILKFLVNFSKIPFITIAYLTELLIKFMDLVSDIYHSIDVFMIKLFQVNDTIKLGIKNKR